MKNKLYKFTLYLGFVNFNPNTVNKALEIYTLSYCVNGILKLRPTIEDKFYWSSLELAKNLNL